MDGQCYLHRRAARLKQHAVPCWCWGAFGKFHSLAQCQYISESDTKISSSIISQGAVGNGILHNQPQPGLKCLFHHFIVLQASLPGSSVMSVCGVILTVLGLQAG